MRPAAAAAASVLQAPRRALGGVSFVAARCASSSSSSVAAAAAATSYDHVSFVNEIAVTDPPEHLNSLLNVLHARGEKIVSPGAKRGLIPLVVPLSESPQGNLTSLLRWPTAPSGMEMPVVEVRSHGLWLLAKNVNQYIHRILVEADSRAESGDDLWSAVRDDLWSAVGEAGPNIYKRGDLKESQTADLDVYLLKKVGLFPDILERKASRHLEKGDNVSALITSEFYTRDQFPGFGRPFVFNSEVQKRIGRTSEAKESARVALKSPWWTLGCRYEEAAELAGWEDEQIEFIREKVSEEGKQDDLKKGKAPEQVVLDEAAFLMDLATVDGNWDEVVDRIADCYREAGIHDIAKFIAYRE
ncbi:protein IN CHLOROPLAST ATPASE BIOGENESIS, chloroplastic-like [Triticum dicoccoides]|uniref:protein IN CHLOROPLAST ATPASE BIOGENESIS, chloroplastic-like n=1 Tax=Triticum dicoccoides TaxID=85692 RepID=UPI00188E08D0|nr:protein IN CHLOROPLAST ATPASE BIOGENESIS, chloroplastic-like [Triticum dicoccoides]